MIHVSLLRGINVGGHHKIRMVELRALYKSLGLHDVTTYIQSGNVVFKAPGHSESSLQPLLEDGIRETFGFEIPVILRAAARMSQVIGATPFGAIDPATEGTRYHVVFLREAPSVDGVAALKALAGETERVEAVDREVYLHCPDGYARTKLSGTNLGRHLGAGATARNWKTVHKLVELAHRLSQ